MRFAQEARRNEESSGCFVSVVDSGDSDWNVCLRPLFKTEIGNVGSTKVVV